MSEQEPTPIDNSTLPTGRSSAIPCWRFNLHRAAFGRYGGSPVDKVWATATTVYWTNPSTDGFASGSRDIGVLYEAETDAWTACLLAVEEAFAERLDKLKTKAKATGETNDH
jgi:hypothetical protein